VVTKLLFVVIMLLGVVCLLFSQLYRAPYRIKSGLINSVFVFVSLFKDAKSLGLVCRSAIFTLLVTNLLGQVPGIAVPSMYYFYTCTLSLNLWVALILVIFITQAKSFTAHMLPFGAPSALMLFLPLVEVFSQIIRPFTLIVRLSTNLSSGHIILYMFSFFSLASFPLLVVTSIVVGTLFLLELFISALQAYIFTSLSFLYISEGLPSS
jgi:F-type H+-transporting ATPase subunit a